MLYVLFVLVVIVCFLIALSLADYNFKISHIKKDMIDYLNEFDKYPKLKKQIIRNCQISLFAFILMTILNVWDNILFGIPAFDFFILVIVFLIIVLIKFREKS